MFVEHPQEEILVLKDKQKIEVESSLKDKIIQLINQDCAYCGLLIKYEQLELVIKILQEEHVQLKEHYSSPAFTQVD